MGLRSAVRSLFELPPASAVTEAPTLDPGNVPTRKGLEYGIPPDGYMREATAASLQHTRQERLEGLNDLYRSCAPITITVNAIARAVTAGGLIVRPDDESPDGPDPAEPPAVLELKRLMRFTNPRENIVQVVRGVTTDLEVFGDAFLEVSWQDGKPVALYSLDAPSMTVDADQHGVVQGYLQHIQGKQEPVRFDPHEIIHFSLDNPRGGVYGLSPVDTVEVPALIWLYTAGCLREAARKGYPPRIHADLDHDQKNAVQRWYEMFQVRHLGPKSIGNPIITTNKGVLNNLQPDHYLEWVAILDTARDVITGTLGAPPNKVNVVESGNLGGGTGESQDKNWRTVTIIPVQSLILEAINFQIVQQGFGIQGWHIEFVEVDYRDTKVVEDQRITRVVHGGWTVNRYRREIGEPPVDGGDDAFVMDRGKFVFVKDMAKYSQAEIDQMEAPMVVAKAGAAEPAAPQPVPVAPKPAEAREAVAREFLARYQAVLEPSGGSNGRNGHSAP